MLLFTSVQARLAVLQFGWPAVGGNQLGW